MKIFNSYNKIFSEINQIRYLIYEKFLLNLNRKKLENILLNKNPQIDIILPTYNRSEMLLKRSIPSILKQTYKNFRLIIIGDKCSDNSEQVIKSFNDKRIYFENLKNRNKRYPETVENHWFAGPVVAINRGLELITGDWITRIDDDDIWTENHLEKLLECVQKNKAEFVSSSYTTVINNIETIKDFSKVTPPIGGVQTWLYVSYLNFFKSNINCWRKSWNRVNDLDLADRMFRAGVKIVYLPISTCIIKHRPNESEIGLTAYKNKTVQFLDKYKFDE
jgi:glycosyltransferase involved in cell wall biosynthesis